ncbi:FKBP-type peptidyl-prolyl cis-trans isomerase [Candidatus Woesearchaeota archaeon]|nr:FKBP-type peptidyl-prolyl cis-trans isomerase [Candidatus Woesearchaeota archaeon]
MLKENDFIEMDYVARIKGNGIFDLTKEDIAKENKIYNNDFRYKPVIVCIGKGDILRGLDNKLIGKDIGKHKIELTPEEGFGKKDGKLIKLVPTKEFTKQNIKPIPGMQMNLDGFMGKIISVTGGRTLVDFNNPLSGKELEYEVEIKRKVTDKKEQLQGFLGILFNDSKVELNNDEAIIEVKELNENMKKELEKEIMERIKIKKVTFKINNEK